MGCKAPIQAARNGEGSIRILPRFVSGGSLQSRLAQGERRLELPCNKCAQCKEARSREWAIRLTHETSMHRHDDGSPNGCMITLTFSNEGLQLRELRRGTHPSTLDVQDWQYFAKKLRQHIVREQRKDEKKRGLKKAPAKKIRFFHVGEYGAENLRPHYHALLFGWDFSEDRVLCKDENNKECYLSETLTRLWEYGKTDIRPIVPETINYVARYVTKKLNGPKLDSWLDRVDPDTGEVVRVSAEFATMSRNPGIGAKWYETFKTDVFPDNFILMKGQKRGVPRFYKRRLKEEDPNLYEEVTKVSSKSAAGKVWDQTPERRQLKERLTIKKQKLWGKRKLD